MLSQGPAPCPQTNQSWACLPQPTGPVDLLPICHQDYLWGVLPSGLSASPLPPTPQDALHTVARSIAPEEKGKFIWFPARLLRRGPLSHAFPEGSDPCYLLFLAWNTPPPFSLQERLPILEVSAQMSPLPRSLPNSTAKLVMTHHPSSLMPNFLP